MNYDKIPVFSRDAFFTFVTVEYYSRDADEDLWRTWNFRHRCDLFNDEIQNVIQKNVMNATISTSDKVVEVERSSESQENVGSCLYKELGLQSWLPRAHWRGYIGGRILNKMGRADWKVWPSREPVP